MVSPLIGSVWTVNGVDGAVVVMVGPFGAESRPEFIVAPVYDGREPGFARSRLDVEIATSESPFDNRRYVGVWNARPCLASDLELKLGTLSTSASEAVRDVYWADLNGERLGTDPRLGRFEFLRRRRIVRFQEGELGRWQPLSAKVWHDAASLPAMPEIPLLETPQFGWDVLASRIRARVRHDAGGGPAWWGQQDQGTGEFEVLTLREVGGIWEDILPANRSMERVTLLAHFPGSGLTTTWPKVSKGSSMSVLTETTIVPVGSASDLTQSVVLSSTPGADRMALAS
ncbi:MAG TPA: hypothetical protein VGA37_08860 [Gemmatimonadales bacterium]